MNEKVERLESEIVCSTIEGVLHILEEGADVQSRSWNLTGQSMERIKRLFARFRAVRDTLRRYRTEVGADRAHMTLLETCYACADFADEQCPGKVVLKFALPAGTVVSANLLKTLDDALGKVEVTT